MIGANQPLYVYQATTSERDAEGRRVPSFTMSAAVVGNLFQVTSRQLTGTTWTTVAEWRALLPAGTTVSYRDEIADGAGVRYRVETVAVRRGPNGAAHHVSCTLKRTED